MKQTVLFIMLTALTFSFSGCKKVEGKGGKATIKGKLMVHAYTNQGDTLLWTAPLGDHRVYIIYGDDNEETYHDDDIRSSYDGSFEFDYLEMGSYTIFTFEDCGYEAYPTFEECYESPILINTEITGKKEVVDVGTINVKMYI